MAVVELKGARAGNFIAESMVDIYGAQGARERCCGPMLAAVERAIERRKALTLAAFDDLSHDTNRARAEARADTERAARQRY